MAAEQDNNNSAASVYRLFGREKPIHIVLGGGKPADIMLWRNKKNTAVVFGVATAIYVLFELLEFHLLTLLCHSIILALAIPFLLSSGSAFLNKSPPSVPQVHIPEGLALQLASALRFEINRAFAILRSIASGQDLKMFLAVIAGLWILSIVGSCCNFLTLFYIAFVLLFTMPVLYEKNEDQVDAYAEQAMHEIRKQYAVLYAIFLSKLPKGQLKDKKAM